MILLIEKKKSFETKKIVPFCNFINSYTYVNEIIIFKTRKFKKEKSIRTFQCVLA